MGPFMAAWIVGMGISIFRIEALQKKINAVADAQAKKNKVTANSTTWPVPIKPRDLVMISGAFVLLALIAESEKARGLATLTAVGLDIAVFMKTATDLQDKNIQASYFYNWNPVKAPDTVVIPKGLSATTVQAQPSATPTSQVTA